MLATLENEYGQRRCAIVFTGYGDFKWHCNHKEFDLDAWKVIAWQPLPKPYKESEKTVSEWEISKRGDNRKGVEMEERYLFKAKRTDNKECVLGSYVYTFVPDKKSHVFGLTRENHFIVGENGNMVLIDKDTLCQCTGLKDKNGKLIWENDIVKDEHGNLYKAFWQNNYYQFSWICVSSEIFQSGIKWDLYVMRSFEIEVIGNIFDNPELLESEV